jgi:hypothetical protein
LCRDDSIPYGFRPVVRESGIEHVTPDYDVSFTGRVRKGREGCPAGQGQGADGLIGPFNASPMIIFDVMGERVARMLRGNSLCE